MQGDIKDVSAGAAKPRGQSTEFDMVFGQQDRSASPSQEVCRGHPTQSAANDNDVVVVTNIL